MSFRPRGHGILVPMKCVERVAFPGAWEAKVHWHLSTEKTLWLGTLQIAARLDFGVVRR